MHQVTKALKFVVLFIVLLAGVQSALAQAVDPTQKVEPSYEVSLHIVIGSNEAVRGAELPSSLGNVSRQLKGGFSFSNYRLVNTFLGRISNTGNIEYKSVSNILGQETETEAQSFLEWSMGNFRVMQDGLQARSFRFGARVPIRVGSTKDDAGRITPTINYEAVGLTMSMIGLKPNTPTLVGTISLPKTTGTIFLVVTIRSADM